MKARNIMTGNPACCAPADPVSEVARMMRDCDCGCIPVVDPKTQKMVGVVTDRDLAVRVLAVGLDGRTQAGEVMTTEVACCHEDSSVDDIERTMANRQVRRVPIVDGDGRCVGIIAQADMAMAMQEHLVSPTDVATVVQKISEPAAPTANKSRGRH